MVKQPYSEKNIMRREEIKTIACQNVEQSSQINYLKKTNFLQIGSKIIIRIEPNTFKSVKIRLSVK